MNSTSRWIDLVLTSNSAASWLALGNLPDLISWWMRSIRSSGGRARITRAFFNSSDLGEQLVVGLVLFERGDQRFHCFDRIEVDHHATELADGFDVMLGKELFFFARAALGNVNGREEAAI